MRGSAFHSSSRVRSRFAPARQSLPSAIFSASATSFSLATLASAVFWTRSARRDSRCPSITGRSASSRAVREARSPTALASVTCARDGLHRFERLLGRHHAGPDPLLEQLDLERQRLEPLGEEGQRLLRGARGVLPHRPLAVGGPDEDVSVLVDATPLVHGPLAHHCGMVVNAHEVITFRPQPMQGV